MGRVGMRVDRRRVNLMWSVSRIKDQAVRWLRRTAEDGVPCYPMFRDDPQLRKLRGDAGYDRLLEEMRRDWERRSEG
jgi:hypothetical protein